MALVLAWLILACASVPVAPAPPADYAEQHARWRAVRLAELRAPRGWLALVARGECVLRYDNEAGKGDHRHVGALEEVYEFVGPRELMADFLDAARRWIHDHGDA